MSTFGRMNWAGEFMFQICHKCAGNLAQSGSITRLRALIPVLEATTTNSKGVEAAISLVLRSECAVDATGLEIPVFPKIRILSAFWQSCE